MCPLLAVADQVSPMFDKPSTLLYDRVSCLIILGGQTAITLPTSYCLLKIQYIDSQRPIDCVSFFSVFMRNLLPEKRVNVVH